MPTSAPAAEVGASRTARSTGMRLPSDASAGDRIASALLILSFGTGAVLLGQDVNYDLRNYHYYNGFAALHGRGSRDLLASQFLQSFGNPGLDVPLFLLIANVLPVVAGFVLGCVQGLNAVLVLAVARRALPAAQGGPPPWPVALAATTVGVLSPLALSELGTTFGDNLLSIPVLAGLLLLCRASPNRPASDLLAGLAIGAAAGLKLTNGPYAVAALLAIALTTPPRSAAGRIAACGAGIALGVAATGGWWMARLWAEYGNPFFPYYNAIFRSPFAQALDWRDARWLPEDAWAIVSYPLAWARAAHPLPSSEKDFCDPRWLVLLGLASTAAILAVIRAAGRLRSLRPVAALERTSAEPSRVLLVYAAIAYLLWLFQFGYSRYLMPLQMISGVLLWILVLRLPLPRRPFPRWPLYALGACLSAWCLLSGLKVPSWGRAPWTESWFDVRIEPPDRLDGATILMVTGEPLSYLVPFFPAHTRFVRVSGTEWDLNTGAFRQRAMAAIDGHTGPLFALAGSAEKVAEARGLLAEYGLALGEPAACVAVTGKLESVRVCPLVRACQARS